MPPSVWGADARPGPPSHRGRPDGVGEARHTQARMISLATTRPRPVLRTPGAVFRVASDARLKKLAAAGSSAAMQAIFARYHQALHRYCYAIVGNQHDAADAVHDAMIRALRSLPSETRPIALRPWLYRIAHDESVSLLRPRRSDSVLDAAHTAPDGALASRDRLRSLTEDLRGLTERQRGALLMRELGGMEFAEIGEALQASAAAAKQSVYEARCALQGTRAGRSMDCYTVQRAISDSDRRVPGRTRLRGHLRNCASCHAFERTLCERAAELQALIPLLPEDVVSAMLHSVRGGSDTGAVAHDPATTGAAR